MDSVEKTQDRQHPQYKRDRASKVSGRLYVKFRGLGEHTFQVYCDQRHFHWFQRFLADQEIKKNSKD